MNAHFAHGWAALVQCFGRETAMPPKKKQVEPAFVLLKSMAAIGRAALDNLNLPPPLVHAAGDAVVLGTALEKFIGGGL